MKKMLDIIEAAGDVEEARFDRKVVEKVVSLTGRNDHNGAILEIAKMIGAKKIEKIIEYLQGIQKILGYMPFDLVKYRGDLSSELEKLAKKKLSKEEYKELYSAF